MGCNGKGSGRDELLPRNAEAIQAFPWYFHLLLLLYGTHDCWCSILSCVLANYGFCRNLSTLYGGCQSFYVADCAEPRFDDVYLVNFGIDCGFVVFITGYE